MKIRHLLWLAKYWHIYDFSSFSTPRKIYYRFFSLFPVQTYNLLKENCSGKRSMWETRIKFKQFISLKERGWHYGQQGQAMYPAGSPSSTRSARCWVKTNPLTQPLSVAVTLLENLTFLTFPSSWRNFTSHRALP